jgi:hypothetical protein
MSPKVHNLRRHFCFVFFVLFIGTSCCSQETLLTTNKNNFYRHGVELSPLSPVMNIYGVLYSYGITKKDWLVAGPVYMRIKYDFGNTDAWALIVGYRRTFGGTFIWNISYIPPMTISLKAERIKYIAALMFGTNFA